MIRKHGVLLEMLSPPTFCPTPSMISKLVTPKMLMSVASVNILLKILSSSAKAVKWMYAV